MYSADFLAPLIRSRPWRYINLFTYLLYLRTVGSALNQKIAAHDVIDTARLPASK